MIGVSEHLLKKLRQAVLSYEGDQTDMIPTHLGRHFISTQDPSKVDAALYSRLFSVPVELPDGRHAYVYLKN